MESTGGQIAKRDTTVTNTGFGSATGLGEAMRRERQQAPRTDKPCMHPKIL